MKVIEQLAEALNVPYRLEKHHVGELRDSCDEDRIRKLGHIFGGDIALELRGQKLLLFVVQQRSAE